MSADQTPLDVNAIRSRLDATSPGMTVDVHDGGSTLQATGNATDRPGFVGAVTGLVDALGGETGQLRLTFADDEDGQDATFALHAANDIRSLLDENARLNAELAEFANTITAPAKQLAEIGAMVGYPDPPGIADAVRAELDRVIREAAADKTKLAAENAGLTACLDAVQQIHRVETYAFGTRTSLGHRVGCYICKTDGPCPTFTAASEMPRPPAEETPPAVSTAGGSTGVPEPEKTAQACGEES